ncbi:MAG: hypothetical protein UY52_C0001G0094 [Parcubacteria group bacterium GW2011_GWC2_49_9]|nr:MAG: hypothetical protein UY34_C0009G0017 [Parcubacteria group bacterium GW2011_GWA2_48_9]KKW16774.1 MAG: hypothetical protein UY52_C0001G0094 [Parcubacteria group bacterium GW2011_GWC2_49_9]
MINCLQVFVGRMPEWSNGVVSKTTVPSRGPQVRILLLPPQYIVNRLITGFFAILHIWNIEPESIGITFLSPELSP